MLFSNDQSEFLDDLSKVFPGLSDSANQRENHIVVLIHGIRTQAPWYQTVRSVLHNQYDLRVVDAGYGFFDALRFWSPILTRGGPIKEVSSQIKALVEDYPDARISVIAHSFGTYILSKLIITSEIEFHRIILCGSIINRKFPWHKYHRRVAKDMQHPHKILNDCGTKDIWPILAEATTFGYGASGSFGFQSVNVYDRFQEKKHSEYFDKKFIQEHWLPYLQNGEFICSGVDRTSPPYWQSILTFLPKWITVSLVATSFFLFFTPR